MWASRSRGWGLAQTRSYQRTILGNEAGDRGGGAAFIPPVQLAGSCRPQSNPCLVTPDWCVCCSRFESDAAVLLGHQQSRVKVLLSLPRRPLQSFDLVLACGAFITVCKIVGSLPSVDPLLRYDLASSFIQVIPRAILL